MCNVIMKKTKLQINQKYNAKAFISKYKQQVQTVIAYLLEVLIIKHSYLMRLPILNPSHVSINSIHTSIIHISSSFKLRFHVCVSNPCA